MINDTTNDDHYAITHGDEFPGLLLSVGLAKTTAATLCERFEGTSPWVREALHHDRTLVEAAADQCAQQVEAKDLRLAAEAAGQAWHRIRFMASGLQNMYFGRQTDAARAWLEEATHWRMEAIRRGNAVDDVTPFN